MTTKTKIFLIISTLLVSLAAYAGSYYRVTLGVTPSCQTGATMTTSVWAEGEFGACDVAKNHPFNYCCAVEK